MGNILKTVSASQIRPKIPHSNLSLPERSSHTLFNPHSGFLFAEPGLPNGGEEESNMYQCFQGSINIYFAPLPMFLCFILDTLRGKKWANKGTCGRWYNSPCLFCMYYKVTFREFLKACPPPGTVQGGGVRVIRETGIGCTWIAPCTTEQVSVQAPSWPPWFKSGLCHLLAVWPGWVSDWISLSLISSICKMNQPHWVLMRVKWNKQCKHTQPRDWSRVRTEILLFTIF